MTALSDVNHMGTSSSEKRNDLAKEILVMVCPT